MTKARKMKHAAGSYQACINLPSLRFIQYWKEKVAWDETKTLYCCKYGCIEQASEGAHLMYPFGKMMYILPTCDYHNPTRSSEEMLVKPSYKLVLSPCQFT